MTKPIEMPLILSTQQNLVALDPATGVKLWSTKLDVTPLRLLPSDSALFVVYRDVLQGIDWKTGRVLATAQVGFVVEVALLADERIFLGGPSECAAFSLDCQRLWAVGRDEVRSGYLKPPEKYLVGLDAAGQETWRLNTHYSVGSGAHELTGLACRGAAAQPDVGD